jgi:hypothetical protein
MILRTVLVKLTDEWATPEGRTAVAAFGAEALSAIPGVVGADGIVAADTASLLSWDVMLQVRFASLEDVEIYRVHPEHLAFLTDYLSPKATFKKVWNWRT